MTSLSAERRAILEELVKRGLTIPAPSMRTPLSFREFIDRVRPGYRWYKHCEVLADVLQRVADGKLKRVMVFMPPRHGKSEQVSRLFPAYYLHRFPQRFVGLGAFGAELAHTLSRNARDFYLLSGGKLRPDAAAIKHWETSEGGGMWASGVGGPALGKGWHLGVIDDPLKDAEESQSEIIRAKQKDWYSSTFYTREEPISESDPNGALVIIQQRWNDDDLSGWLLSEEESGDNDYPEKWHVVNFEAIKEADPPRIPDSCTLEPDWRNEGEALCPERRPIHKLLAIKRRMTDYFWSALFQQRPRSRDGALFPPGCLVLVPAHPSGLTLVRYWDKAGAKPGKGDWTVGVLMGRTDDNRFFVIDVVRGQWPPEERNRVILQTAARDEQTYGSVTIYVEQPPGLAKESTDAVIRMLAGFDVHPDPVNKDKVERAEPLSAQARAGNVFVVKNATWNRPYLAVMEGFPFGVHDDDVDASSGAFNKLAVEGRASWQPDPFGDRRW
jgi:predicted phage terminase large subunit-like protein